MAHRCQKARVLGDGDASQPTAATNEMPCKTHQSLSAIARTITGTKWNGPRFFGMRKVKAASENGDGNQ